METKKEPNITLQTEDGNLLTSSEVKKVVEEKKKGKTKEPKKLLGQHPITGEDVYHE